MESFGNWVNDTLNLDQVEARDRAYLIDAIWPYDGPHSPDAVMSAAAAARELVRYMNNATGAGNGSYTLRYAPTAYRVTSHVRSAVASLDQLMQQLTDAAERYATDETIYDDRPEVEAVATAREALEDLTVARERLRGVEVTMQRAAMHLGHLGHDAEVSSSEF